MAKTKGIGKKLVDLQDKIQREYLKENDKGLKGDKKAIVKSIGLAFADALLTPATPLHKTPLDKRLERKRMR